MQLETQFNIGDKVFVLYTSNYSYSRILELSVNHITIGVNSKGDIKIDYDFVSTHFASMDSTTGRKTFSSDFVFASKKDLLKHLGEYKQDGK